MKDFSDSIKKLKEKRINDVIAVSYEKYNNKRFVIELLTITEKTYKSFTNRSTKDVDTPVNLKIIANALFNKHRQLCDNKTFIEAWNEIKYTINFENSNELLHKYFYKYKHIWGSDYIKWIVNNRRK